MGRFDNYLKLYNTLIHLVFCGFNKNFIKSHYRCSPLFIPFFSFPEKNPPLKPCPLKKHVTENTSPKRSTDPDPTVDRDRLAAEANLYEFMKSRVGGPSTDGAVGCDLFFSQICVFFCLRNICLLRDGDWNIPMGFKSSPMKKNASNILKGEAFWITFFSPSASIPVANLRWEFFELPRPHEN